MAAAPSSLGEQIREELTCSICLELFTRPKVLPCGHTFCQGCLVPTGNHYGHGRPGTALTFQCPNCHQQVELPPEGVSDFPDNHLVTSLFDRLRKQNQTFGEPGTGRGQLSKPIAVAVSQEGEIFVANGMRDHIQRFTLQGDFISDISTILDPPYVGYIPESINAHSVAIDKGGNAVVVGAIADGHVYVAVYNEGILANKFRLDHKGWRGVAVDHKNDTILIVQTTGSEPWNFHSEVQVFSRAPQPTGNILVLEPTGTLVRTVGQQQGMKDARYIAVDGEGNILVSDWENHCVFVYNEDGLFLFQFGGWGSGEGQLKHPCGICTDRAGNIIIADSGNNRVEMFDKTGSFIRHITTDMTRPCAVAMAPQGEVVVTDIQSNTITIFGTN